MYLAGCAQIKCERYWPDVIGESVTYGSITVKNVDCEQFPDYTVRTFRVTKDVSISSCFQLSVCLCWLYSIKFDLVCSQMVVLVLDALMLLLT